MRYMYWWDEGDIEIVKINGELYALDGWNGEIYLHCWKCLDRFTADPEDKEEYKIRPIYGKPDEDGNEDYIGYELMY